jgi:hypothetical protein
MYFRTFYKVHYIYGKLKISLKIFIITYVHQNVKDI